MFSKKKYLQIEFNISKQNFYRFIEIPKTFTTENVVSIMEKNISEMVDKGWSVMDKIIDIDYRKYKLRLRGLIATMSFQIVDEIKVSSC